MKIWAHACGLYGQLSTKAHPRTKTAVTMAQVLIHDYLTGTAVSSTQLREHMRQLAQNTNPRGSCSLVLARLSDETDCTLAARGSVISGISPDFNAAMHDIKKRPQHPRHQVFIQTYLMLILLADMDMGLIDHLWPEAIGSESTYPHRGWNLGARTPPSSPPLPLRLDRIIDENGTRCYANGSPTYSPSSPEYSRVLDGNSTDSFVNTYSPPSKSRRMYSPSFSPTDPDTESQLLQDNDVYTFVNTPPPLTLRPCVLAPQRESYMATKRLMPPTQQSAQKLAKMTQFCTPSITQMQARDDHDHDDHGTDQDTHNVADIPTQTQTAPRVARVGVTRAESVPQSQVSDTKDISAVKALKTLKTRINATQSSRRDNKAAISEIEVFCGRLTRDQKAIIFVDDGSEINIISDTAVSNDMIQRTCNPVIIKGIGFEGAQLTSSIRVKVPILLRSGSKPVHIWCYSINDAALPEKVDLLLGKPFLKKLKVRTDTANMRLEIQSLNMTVDTMPISEQIDKMSACPLRFLEICGGASLSYHTLRNLGYDFELFHSIEIDEKARDIATAHSAGAVSHMAPHDLYLIPDVLMTTYTDILVTTECGPWSRASGPVPPKGFKDPRAQLFIKACAILRDQRKRNPRVNILFENVDIHPALAKTDGPKQEELVGATFHVVNATDLGSMSSRPRRIASNMATPDDLRHRKPPAPSFAIGEDKFPVIHPMYCLISKAKTWNPQQCRDSKGILMDLSGDERDVYMGHIRGSTKYACNSSGSKEIVTEDYRRQLLGKGIHAAHVAAYFACRDNSQIHVSRAFATSVAEAHPEQLELFLSDMLSAERRSWFKANTMASYTKLKLKIEVDMSNGLPQQMINYGQGGKLDASMLYALQLLVKAGHLEQVAWSKDFMISPCFPKQKVGRTFPESDLPLVRVLNDLRLVNQRLIQHKDEFQENNPTRNRATSSVPHGATWFGDIDMHDAFHYGVLHEDSRQFLVIYWKGVCYKWVGIPQGLACASGYWMALMVHLLNTALGNAWSNTCPPMSAQNVNTTAAPTAQACQPWYIGYIDDWMPVADSEQRCRNRQDILLDILHLAGLPLSPKCKLTVSQTGNLIGLKWTDQGHSLDDEAIASLTKALELIPRTTNEALAVIGLINYSENAFHYTHNEQARHGELMAILNDAVTATKEHGRLKWNELEQGAVSELASRMQNLPRASYDPLQLFSSGKYTIVILGDASKTGAGSSLYLVQITQAEDFTKEHLLSKTTLLVDCYHKVLSKGQKKWQTYETETWIMVKSVTRWAKYIARALYMKTHWQHNKILMLSDSTTAASKWFTLTLPEYDLDFICAKARRFLSWADKVAYTQNWPLVTRHLPGEYNSLSHMLSHVGDLLTEMYQHPDPAHSKMEQKWFNQTQYSKVSCPKESPLGVTSKLRTMVVQVNATRGMRQAPQSMTHPQNDTIHSYLGCSVMAKCTLSACTPDSAVTMAAQFHSYHGLRPAKASPYAEPPNFKVNHINIKLEDLSIFAEAYRSDQSPFHKVTLSRVYTVAIGELDGVDRLVIERVQSWLDNKIFAICPPGADIPLLYTPASSKFLRWGDPAVLDADERLDTTLVPIVPNACQISLLNLTPIAKADDDNTHDQFRDLRHSILMLAHGLQSPHANRVTTLTRVRRMAAWQEIERDVKAHCDQCDTCLTERDPLVRLGSMMTSSRRMGTVMLDKLKLPKEVVEITDIPAVLIFTCPHLGDSVPAIVESMTAVESARVIFCTVIPRYSIPYQLVSDSEPAFASEVAQELAKLMGIPEWDFGAVTSPTHHAKVEVRMKPYKRAIKQATDDGQIKCRRSLEVVLAKAQITHTQHMVTYGSTAFTRLTGAIPRTIPDLFSTPPTLEIENAEITESDRHILKSLAAHVTNLGLWHQEEREAAHRNQTFSRIAAECTKTGTDFYIKEGDMVSYNSERWKLMEVIGPPNAPITAIIQKATHEDAVQTKTVRYDTLQNLASSREKLNIELDSVVKPGQYVFFTDDADLTCSGKVTHVTDHHSGQLISIHAHDPSPQLQCFTPNWTKGSNEKSQRKQPRGYEPEIIQATTPQLEVITTIDDSFHIPNQAFKELKAKGVVMPFEYATSATVVTSSPVTANRSKARPHQSRRSRFDMNHTQHSWIIKQLREMQSTVTYDAFTDHARLLQIMVHGYDTFPSGAAMDANDTAIMRLITPRPGGTDHVDGNQVWRMQVWMLMHPNRTWLKARNSTKAAATHSQGQYRKRQEKEAQRLREEQLTPTRLAPARDRSPMITSHPSYSPPQYRSKSPSPDRQAVHCVPAQQTNVTPNRTKPNNKAAIKCKHQPCRATYVSRLRRQKREYVQQHRQAHHSPTAAPWYLQLKQIFTSITIHLLAIIGAIHLISVSQIPYGK